jgi:hypothetical protein
MTSSDAVSCFEPKWFLASTFSCSSSQRTRPSSCSFYRLSRSYSALEIVTVSVVLVVVNVSFFMGSVYHILQKNATFARAELRQYNE